jgi:hypothetical protein
MTKCNRAVRAGFAAVVGCLALSWTAGPAHGRVACGTEMARSSGQIFRIVGGGVGCRTAKALAGAWFDATSRGKPGRLVADQRGKRWACRVTQRATGTDPGFIPYTSVRCTRHRAVVRFQQRS